MLLLPGRKAAAALGVCQATLRQLADSGQIPSVRLPSGQRRYEISQIAVAEKPPGDADRHKGERRKFCYCRVSRTHQKADLQRQVEHMRERFPDHEIVTDIGSGINFKRKGLQTILRLAMLGAVEEVVVAYRDRLARIAADLVEWILQTCQARLVVLHPAVGGTEADLAEDLLAIVNVFCCRANGRRKYRIVEAGPDNQEEDPQTDEA